MAKVTLIFAALAILLGLIGFFGTGGVHPTALIPAWIGLALAVGGLLAVSPSERRRKLFMHINVTVGLIGFLGSAVIIAINLTSSKPVDGTAMEAKIALAVLMLIYVLLCVRSFINARRSGKV